MAKKDTEEKRIFSGESSEEMWRRINKLNVKGSRNLFWALYILGCKCQELEAEVARLRKNKAA